MMFLLLLSAMGYAAESPPLPYMKASDFTPFWKDQASASSEGPAPATVSAFRFKNQANQELTDQNMKGHVSLVNFFFTSCGSVCPRLMNQVQRVQKKLPSALGVRIYSISVTPEADSPARLADYAKSRGIGSGRWDLLTGPRAEIYRLGREVFRADRNPDGTLSRSEFIHSQAIYLVDSELHIRGIYQSDKPSDMALLAQDAIRLAGQRP